MVSETSLAAQQCRLREWAEQIRDCQNRAEGMSVIEWCSRNGITKANYYYRLRRVRAACLEQFPEETAGRQVIPVPSEFLSFQEITPLPYLHADWSCPSTGSAFM